jgi:hypothetical protein
MGNVAASDSAAITGIPCLVLVLHALALAGLAFDLPEGLALVAGFWGRD